MSDGRHIKKVDNTLGMRYLVIVNRLSSYVADGS